MREVRFRAWDPFNGIMWGHTNHYKGDLATFFKEYQDTLAGENKPVLMQYTGLKDKNGKEIYEGDIVERGGSHYTIYWHEFTACWKMTGHTGITKGDMALMCKVIGNIYENGDLLKEA